MSAALAAASPRRACAANPESLDSPMGYQVAPILSRSFCPTRELSGTEVPLTPSGELLMTPVSRPAAAMFLAVLFSAPAAATAGQSELTRATAPSPARCVALPLPSVRGAEGSATDLATPLRDLVASYLSGPTLRTVTLDARLPAQAL